MTLRKSLVLTFAKVRRSYEGDLIPKARSHIPLSAPGTKANLRNSIMDGQRILKAALEEVVRNGSLEIWDEKPKVRTPSFKANDAANNGRSVSSHGVLLLWPSYCRPSYRPG